MTTRPVPATGPIDKSKVASVYSGRHGCCCGCNGKHTYASAHAQAGTVVSDRTVATIVNKLNRVIEAGNEAPEGAEDDMFQVTEAEGYGRTFFSYATERRLYVVYYARE